MEHSLDSKKCFYCHAIKPLEFFKINNRKYQVAKEKGRCVACTQCDYNRAVERMGVVRFNYELGKFEVINFETIEELNSFYEVTLHKR